MNENQLNLTASDIRVFVPARDFQQSLRFYTLLGWRLNWQADDGKLSILELANCRFMLQDYYVRAWANNFMLQVIVNDARAWHQHVAQILQTESFAHARINPPKEESYGALVTHVWDPSGVLIHFTEFLRK